MKGIKMFRPILPWIIILFLGSCGPVILSSKHSNPPPPWFYPNRLEMIRYVYFPEYSIYYDLSAHNYLYLDGGVWIRVNVLPPRYRNIDLRRSRYKRVRDYHDDNIGKYHDENNANRGRSNKSSSRDNGNSTRRND